MRIRNPLLILSATLAATLAAVPVQAGAVLDRVVSNKVLTVAADADYPPQSFLNDQNEMDGFDVAVAREIANRLGATLKVVTPSWEMITSGSWGGRWDISVGSMTPTTERQKILDFPAVYYYTPAAFAVHEESEISTYSQLDGKVIGACGGCTTESYLKGDLLIEGAEDKAIDYVATPGEIRSYETDTNIFDDLRLGSGLRIDATLSPLPTILEAIKNRYPLKVVSDPVYYEPLAIAVDKGDAEFSSKIKTVVENMHADGTLSELSMKWYGFDYTKAK